jgi:predicted helicase
LYWHHFLISLGGFVSNKNSNTELDLNSDKFIQETIEALKKLDKDEREHYQFLSKAVLKCYFEENNRAVVTISKGIGQTFTLISVNADDHQTNRILSDTSDAVGFGHSQPRAQRPEFLN